MPIIVPFQQPVADQKLSVLLALHTDYYKLKVGLSLQVGGLSKLGVVLTMTTQPIIRKVGVTLKLRTYQPPPPGALPYPTTVGGDSSRTINPSGHDYLITSSGGPLPIESYRLSYPDPTSATDASTSTQQAKPSGEVVCRGVVAPQGSVTLNVSARGRNSNRSYAARYGPFTVTEATVNRKSPSVTTTLRIIDSTAADLAAVMPILGEYIPWEAIKHASPADQAAYQKLKAAQAQAIEKQNQLIRLHAPAGVDAQCVSAPMDTRKVGVNDTILWALGQMPGKWALTAPLPWGGMYFAADPEVDLVNHVGWLSVSYSTYGKTPLGVVSDLLGMLGWKAVARGGVYWIGPPGTLLDPDSVSDVLGVPLDELTETSNKTINVGTTISLSDQGASGDYSRPRWVDFTGASTRAYLAPLPTDDPVQTFELERDGTISGSSYTGAGLALESVTRWSKTKSGGLLRSEDEVTDGQVQNPGLNPPRIWKAGRSHTITSHSYGDANYPRAETGTDVQTYAWVEGLNRTELTVQKTTTQQWDDTGYLKRRVTVTRTMNGWTTFLGTGGTGDLGSHTIGGVTVNLSAVLDYQVVTEVEEWTPDRPGWWLHTINRTYDDYVPVLQDGTPVDSQRVTRTDGSSEETDQGPPRAPEGNCATEKPLGFPYDTPLTAHITTGGRADPATVSAPWARVVPDFMAQYLQSLKASLRNEVRYNCQVPIQVPDGGAGTGAINIQGKYGVVSSDVTLTLAAT